MGLGSRSVVWQKQDDNNKYTKDRYDIYNPAFNSFQKDIGKEIFSNKLDKYKDDYINFISWARWYPDIFLDLLKPPDSKFRLFAYQKIWLRIFFRYKYVFLTASRGSAKSFLEVLAFALSAILYPRIKLSITAGGSKEQAKNIASEKLNELLELYPMFKSEIRSRKENNDSLEVYFRNGSVLKVIAASQNSRGLRSHRGCIEEALLINTELLNDIIIPLFNVDRITANGLSDPSEFLNSQILFVTTAGYAGTDVHSKMMHYFKEMCEGKKSICIGSGYELSLYHGLLKQDKIDDLMNDPNYGHISFSTEYKSEWLNFSNRSFFNVDELNACRTIKHAEFYSDFKKHPNDFYVVGYDVSRSGGSSNDASVLSVFRCTERKDGTFIKNLVHMQSYEDVNKNNTSTASVMHFKNQCIEIKRCVEKFNPKAVCIDAGGLGAGLLDFLTDITEDEEYGKTYPAYGVVSLNAEDVDNRYEDNAIPILHLIKTSGGNASAIMNDMNNILKGHIQTRNLRLLVDEREMGLDPKEKSVTSMIPYLQTSFLINELMQLEVDIQGTNIKLKPATQSMRKDRYSSVSYTLWWIVRYLEEENKINISQNHKVSATDYLFIN